MRRTTTKQSRTVWALEPQGKTRKWFSADEVINAYFRGKKDQKDQNEKVLMEKLSANLDMAKKLVVEFLELLTEKGVHCESVRLKVVSITDFDALFIVSENDFVKPLFKEVYKSAIDFKKKSNTETFNLSFSFMPFSKHMSDTELLSDGFILKYGKTK